MSKVYRDGPETDVEIVEPKGGNVRHFSRLPQTAKNFNNFLCRDPFFFDKTLSGNLVQGTKSRPSALQLESKKKMFKKILVLERRMRRT